MAIDLHKILVTEDQRQLIKSMYAEDLPLLATFHQNAGQGLEACVDTTLAAISPESKFFKIETEDGTLFGYFVVSEVPEGEMYPVMEGFFIRPLFRKKEYKDAFIALINSTFANNFYTSTGVNNYRAISFLLKYNFHIENYLTFDDSDKTFVLLKAVNPNS